MSNSTFSGPVRSENGFETISKNATTGVVTVTSGSKMSAEAVGSAGIEGTAAVYITQVERLKSDTDTNVNIVKTKIMIDLISNPFAMCISRLSGPIKRLHCDNIAADSRIVSFPAYLVTSSNIGSF